MSWLSRRKRPSGELGGIADGVQRSPGLGALTDELERRREAGAEIAALDLGASSHDNLTFLRRWASHIAIRDLAARGAGHPGAGHPGAGHPGALCELQAGLLRTDDPGERYDMILLWDLLHYVLSQDTAAFVAELAALCRPSALVLLMTSTSAPIPRHPIRFRVRDPEHLIYEVTDAERQPTPHLHPRDVEKRMVGFEPLRLFQLRNGLQEHLFRYKGHRDPRAGEPDLRRADDELGKGDPMSVEGDERPPGDWY